MRQDTRGEGNDAFLTGPRKLGEIMEKLEILVNEMMADEGPLPVDLGSVGVHDTKTTHGESDTINDMSYEEMCVITWKVYKNRQGSRQEGTERIGNVASWERS